MLANYISSTGNRGVDAIQFWLKPEIFK